MVNAHNSPSPAKLTKTAARALRRLRGGGVLVALGARKFTDGRDCYQPRTIEPLIRAGLMSRPQDLVQTAPNAGKITDAGLAALDWSEKGSGS